VTGLATGNGTARHDTQQAGSLSWTMARCVGMRLSGWGGLRPVDWLRN